MRFTFEMMRKAVLFGMFSFMMSDLCAQDVIPRKARGEKNAKTMNAQTRKSINFEGISMDDAWKMCLEFEDRGFKQLSAEQMRGAYLTTFKGVYGPKKDVATIMQTKGKNVKKVTCVAVELKTKKASFSELKSYLEKEFCAPEYDKRLNTYVYYLNDGTIYLVNKGGQTSVTYMH